MMAQVWSEGAALRDRSCVELRGRREKNAAEKRALGWCWWLRTKEVAFYA